MPRKRKFERSRKEPKTKFKRKEKFNYRTASYIKEREAKNEQIENQRKLIEERKARQQQKYDESSGEEEENPINDLLKTFNVGHSINKFSVCSDSESEADEEEDKDTDTINEEDTDVEQGVDAESKDDEDIDEEQDVDVKDDTDEDEHTDTNENSDEKEYSDQDDENKTDDIDQSDESDSTQTVFKEKVKLTEPRSVKNSQIRVNINDCNEEDEQTAEEDAGHIKDPFSIHIRNDLDNELYQAVSNVPVPLTTGKLNWNCLGNIIYQIPKIESESNETVKKKKKFSLLEDKLYAEPGKIPQLINKIDWNELYVKSAIQNNISRANYSNIKNDLDKNADSLTSFQKELFSIINNYQDLLYCERNFDNETEVRFVYCLHVINHVLKTRTKVLHHNAKIKKANLNGISEIPDEYKDQGLVRPKILIIVPFRNSCLKIIEMLISIFIGEEKGGSVINKIRFMEDFGSSEIIMPKKNPKPEDYEQTFKGNIDDTFKIGVSITKKAMKLYSDFYSSDIIISSVLGLRMTIGAEGEEERDYDFLASIELLIMDQVEIFLMQNWHHVLHIFEHLHLQPRNAHNTDFSRVRSWCINGWSKYYRQTLIFSGIHLPEIHGIFNKFCHNYAGKLKVMNPVSTGSIVQIIAQVPQFFHRFNPADHTKSVESRFQFFTTKILPQFRDSIMNHTLVFIPSYFDFVKLRNYFRREEISFVQICEYSQKPKIARARDMFFHSDAHFVLYTERFHFFRRIRVKGIRHIIFYGPPVFSHFYSEMCNLMQEGYQNPKAGSRSNMSVTTLYCKYDIMPLSEIVGTERANLMVTSDKTVHMVMTG